MINVYVEATNIITSLGFSTKENFKNIVNQQSGIQIINNSDLWHSPFPASIIDTNLIDKEINDKSLTKFDKLILTSAKKALQKSKIDPSSNRTLFILSTTKGNVNLLEKNALHPKAYLWQSAKILSNYFNNKNKVQIVSNACISGLMAIIIGQRLIQNNNYDNVVVVGADVLSKFIVSGFMSFHSLSADACKPFDKNRTGLSLGEGAGTIVLTNNKNIIKQKTICVKNGAISNDANHISGPSRTGEGLLLAIKNTLENNEKPDFISAHGTATPYNDDMESKAITRAGLQQTPTNSLKGYFGHTLGAAGVIESIISVKCLENNQLIKTIGLKEQGTSEKINIITQNKQQELNSMLKLVSGFGGGNAAALFTKLK